MELQQREKKLMVAVGVLFAVVALYYLYGMVFGGGAMGNPEALRTSINKLENEISRAKNAQRKLNALNKRSLPTRQADALERYQAWLRGLVEQSGFKDARISVKQKQPIKNKDGDVGVNYAFSVTGVGSLEKVIRFLFSFYSSGNLQKVRTITLEPKQGSKELDISIDVEALALTTGDNPSLLTKEKGDQLKLPSLDIYQAGIVKRDFFSVYVPPKPNPPPEPKKDPPKPPSFDAAKYVILTAVIETDGQSVAWIRSKPTDKTIKVRAGEDFEIGPIKGKCLRVGVRDIDIEIDGEKKTIAYGESLGGK